jgi:hypothetical protein
MSHSLIGADCRTHVRIVAVALAGAISLVVFGIAASPPQPDAPGAQARADGPVLKAGKPPLSAAAGMPLMR